METTALFATTTRPVRFAYKAHGSTLVTETRVYPTGTEVHVTRARRGYAEARVVGTLFEQQISLDDLAL